MTPLRKRMLGELQRRPPRVCRKHQRLPSNLVIENPRQHKLGFHLHRTRRAFPMNANGLSGTGVVESQVGGSRNLVVLSSSFAALATLLAAVGLHGCTV
jgi:hypothetical protein